MEDNGTAWLTQLQMSLLYGKAYLDTIKLLESKTKN